MPKREPSIADKQNRIKTVQTPFRDNETGNTKLRLSAFKRINRNSFNNICMRGAQLFFQTVSNRLHNFPLCKRIPDFADQGLFNSLALILFELSGIK